MNWQEFLLTVPLLWIVAIWLFAIVLVALTKVYAPVERGQNAPLYAKIASLLALALPLVVAFRVAYGTIQEASFLLSASTLLGVSLGGLALGAMVSKAIIFALGGEPRTGQVSDEVDVDGEVLLNGEPLDDL